MTKHSKPVKIVARLLLLAALGGVLWLAGKTVYSVARAIGAFRAQPVEIADRDPDKEKATELAQAVAERVSYHESLPQGNSFLGALGWGRDQASNEVVITDLLGQLTREIGATKAYGAIGALQENREAKAKIEQLLYSPDPETVADAKTQLEVLRKENIELEATVRRSLSNEGIELSDEQIKSLCASPNAQDLASMISSFGSLKAVAAKMEARLRLKPSLEQGQRYYGAYYALLVSLDIIQTRAMHNIEEKHLPKARKIREESRQAAKKAAALLAETPELSKTEKQALAWNIKTCEKTVEIANRTEDKLSRNLEILRRANARLQKSVATAENCHMTTLLQKEIIGLETSHAQEIARIEALTVPELAAINFADPENIEVSPAAPTPQPAP